MREIFLSRKESFPMETNINMNNNEIENINLSTAGHQAANKIYVDNNTNNKADLTITTTQIFQSRVQVPDFNQSSHSGLDVANINYINNKFLNKNTGGVMQNPITFQSSLSNNKKQINNFGTPQFNSSATNKQYVDSEISKISIDLPNFIKKDGSVSMVSDLNMGNNFIENVKTPLKNNDGANKTYVDKMVEKSHLSGSHKKMHSNTF